MWRYFNTGDQIWMEWRYGKWEVIKIVSHDGLLLSEDDLISLPWKGREIKFHRITKLSGMEKFFHRIEVACLKVAHKVFQAG